MLATKLSIPEVILFEPKVFGDDRGVFYESFNNRVFEEATGLKRHFVQDNHSRSGKNVLRGLHYQIQNPSLGWRHKIVLEEGIRKTYQWYCEN